MSMLHALMRTLKDNVARLTLNITVQEAVIMDISPRTIPVQNVDNSVLHAPTLPPVTPVSNGLRYKIPMLPHVNAMRVIIRHLRYAASLSAFNEATRTTFVSNVIQDMN